MGLETVLWIMCMQYKIVLFDGFYKAQENYFCFKGLGFLVHMGMFVETKIQNAMNLGFFLSGTLEREHVHFHSNHRDRQLLIFTLKVWVLKLSNSYSKRVQTRRGSNENLFFYVCCIGSAGTYLSICGKRSHILHLGSKHTILC